MKAKIVIELETKGPYEVVPEEGTSEEDYTKEELENFRKDWEEGLMNHAKKMVQKYMEPDGSFEDWFVDELEENYIEGWDSFKDYKLTVTVKEEKND